jgi:diguanylate cyclase (GGDEF)-like protein
MAARDPHTPPPVPPELTGCLSEAEVHQRLDEEINRAGRHGTALSCLLVGIANLQEIEQTHGQELSDQALAYVALILGREFRRFDRVGRPGDSDFLVVLPGADGPRGEIVARRVLARLRAIKLEVDGQRRPLHVTVGLSAWRNEQTAAQLMNETREAARREWLGFQDALRI